MATIVHDFHPSPDIWLAMHLEAGRSGIQFLTPRAKRWAAQYKEIEDPAELDHMIMVDDRLVAPILHDIAHDTSLHVLFDHIGSETADA
jgi:hypothetical protein